MRIKANQRSSRLRRLIIIVILLILSSALWYFQKLMPIMTGYVAKNMASAVFVAGRNEQSMVDHDLNFSVLPLVNYSIDSTEKSVTAHFLWNKSKAIFIPGYGCTLVKDYKESTIRNRPYPKIPCLPENPDTIPWPLGNLIKSSIPSNIDSTQLARTVKEIMSDSIPFKGTYGLMIIYKGYPITEIYQKGFNKTTRFLSWSMAKSFTNTLIGLRVKENKLTITEPAKLKIWESDKRKDISLNNLMHMNSGLSWNESYGSLSDVTIMLHKVGNMGMYTAKKTLKYTPDSVWEYSSGSSNLASYLLRESFSSDSLYWAFPRKKLFNPLGMKSAVFELDASGTFVGSSYLYATLRDYGRYALFLLNNGKYMGKQLLPENWMNYSLTPAKGSKGLYGSFFWLNTGQKDQPAAPADTYMCKGHDGQYIVIIPSKQLIIIRTGYSKKGEFDTNKMISEILKSIKNS